MNIGTKSVSVGSITLNNIKHSKVRSNTKAISSDGYEEIDYNIPSSSINVDKEVKELENIRDILVERKEKLTPRYDNWQSNWDFVSAQDFDHQTIKKYEMMGEQFDSTSQQLQDFNTEQSVRSFSEVLAENKVQLEQEEMMRQRMGFINSQLQSNLSEENWNRKLKIEADPHYELYNQMWLNHLNSQDDSLIKKAKELEPNCSPDDYYFVWASAMCDENIFDVLEESNDVRDLQLYQTLTSVEQQKEDLIVEKTYLDNEIGMLDANIRQLNQLINEYPYMQIMESDDFKKYAENYQYSDLDKVATIYNSTQLTDKKSLTDKIIDKKLGSYISLDSGFVYLSEQEKILYRYLLETEGQDSVDAFMEAYRDKINQNHGYQLANAFINSLDLDSEGNVKKSLSNSLGVSVEGLEAGIDNFLTGLQNAIINNDELSVEDYKNMIVIQYLIEHSDYEFLYSFSQSFGNMLIPMVVSIAVSAVATPASGAVVSSSLMGVSAFGNAKHQALVGGNDLISSTLYGVFVGASEATLGYFLGRIPGISQVSGLTFKNLLMEGVEEFSQEWIDAGLRAVILEENVDWSTVPEQSMEAFLMGALMSGFTNGGQAVTHIIINGTTYNLNVEDTLMLIHDNPNMTLQQAMENANPGIFDLFKGKNQVNNSGTSFKALDSNLIESTLARYGNNYYTAFADIIYNVSQTSSSEQLRATYRSLSNYLISKGMSQTDACNILTQAGTGAINLRGFTTKQVNLNGNNIVIREQSGINYANQSFTPSVILNNIAKLPIELQKLVHTVNIYDTFNPADLYWEQVYGMKDFCSQATGSDGVINFYGFANNRFHESTIPHEIAHTYDTECAAAWNIKGRISQSPLWANVMSRDQSINGLNGVTEYARQSHSPVEDFAESVALFYTHPEILNRFPNRKALLDRMLPKNEKISVNYDLGVTVNMEAAQAFDLALDTMIRKYGKKQTIINIQTYLDSGRLDLITGENGARNALGQVSLEDVRMYIKSINQGSLDISKLVN